MKVFLAKSIKGGAPEKTMELKETTLLKNSVDLSNIKKNLVKGYRE